MPPSRPPPEERTLDNGGLWETGRGMASGGALGRELASDWPPEGMTRTVKDHARRPARVGAGR
jgi:hypothetical protein